MYKFLLLYALSFFSMLCFIGCGNAFLWTKIGENTKIYNEYDKTITFKQLDSLCKADTLNPDYNTWYKMIFYDEETKDKITEYIYIKSNNDLKETSYILRTVNEINTEFNITKRITIKQESK